MSLITWFILLIAFVQPAVRFQFAIQCPQTDSEHFRRPFLVIAGFR